MQQINKEYRKPYKVSVNQPKVLFSFSFFSRVSNHDNMLPATATHFCMSGKNILCLVIKMERDPFFFFLQLIPTAHYVTSAWLLMFQLQDTVY